MDLQTTKKVIAEILQELGLNPKTVPEDEMLVELFIIQKQFDNDKHVHVNLKKHGIFEIEDDPEAPRVDIIVQSGGKPNSSDGCSRRLCITYYGGDNIPTGPRHGLAIIDLIIGKLIYWRSPRQDPATAWRYNVFAHDQNDFQFTLQDVNSSQ